MIFSSRNPTNPQQTDIYEDVNNSQTTNKAKPSTTPTATTATTTEAGPSIHPSRLKKIKPSKCKKSSNNPISN